MINEIKKQFPIFSEKKNGKDIVYLDTAATAQRPEAVIKATDEYNKKYNANPHRGVYTISAESTEIYEGARKKVAAFIGVPDAREVIFTKNTTESLNLIAYSYGMNFLKKGDRIVISIMEHHSNLIPWQRVCAATGAKLEYLYTENGIISDEEIEKKLTPGVKIVALTHISNVLGIMTPYKKIFDKAHEIGALTVLDAAQSVPHIKINATETGADFIAFSGHKLYSPLGIGVLWGRREILEEMPPFLTGGDMIDSVREQDATFAALPQKFEAGTQNVIGAAGLAAAIDWIESVGFDTIAGIEDETVEYMRKSLSQLGNVMVYGDEGVKHYGSVSFNLEGIHPHDVASILDSDGICIRAGHHCAQPLLSHMNINPCYCEGQDDCNHAGITCFRAGVSCCRASVGVYNGKEDIDKLCEGLNKVRKWLGYGS